MYLKNYSFHSISILSYICILYYFKMPQERIQHKIIFTFHSQECFSKEDEKLLFRQNNFSHVIL